MLNREGRGGRTEARVEKVKLSLIVEKRTRGKREK